MRVIAGCAPPCSRTLERKIPPPIDRHCAAPKPRIHPALSSGANRYVRGAIVTSLMGTSLWRVSRRTAAVLLARGGGIGRGLHLSAPALGCLVSDSRPGNRARGRPRGG